MTNATVRAAWAASVFANASITALTDKIYDYDVTLESTKEFSKLRYRQELNFFTYVVTRAERVMIMGQTEQIYTVRVRYTRQADVAGTVYKIVSDAFETIQDLARTALTTTWGSTIDFYRVRNGPPNIVQQTLENLSVWVGELDFMGYKYTG